MKVQVNGNWYEVELSAGRVRINGVDFDLELSEDEMVFGGKKYSLDFLLEGEPSIAIVNGMSYLISKSVSEAEAVKELRAPMSGQVVEVSVGEGSDVTRGQLLVTLEAMKMENQIRSPRDGRVKLVKVKKGQLAIKGEVLLTFN